MIFSNQEQQQQNSNDFESNQNNVDPIDGKVFISQLPNDLGEKDIIAIFGEYGAINDIRIVPANHFQSQKLTGCAFVTFATVASASKAVERLHDKLKFPNVIGYN